MTGPKFFTPRQANQTLPLVKRIVADILRMGEEARKAAELSEGDPEEDPTVQSLVGQLEQLFEELETIGCLYKDWDFTMGLVDFPSKFGGREVLLCWRSDEPSVRFYHEPDAGYAGRKLIPENELD